ncbi:hypothetical protein ScPMuIL_015749 [Solemya velum]
MDAVELKGMRKNSKDSDDIIPPTDSNYGSLDNVIVDSKDVNLYPEDNPVFMVEAGDVRKRGIKPNFPDERELDEKNSDDGYLRKITHNAHVIYHDNSDYIWNGIYIFLLVLYFAYFGYAMYWEFGDEGSVRLMVCTVIAVIFIAYRLIMKNFGDRFNFNCCKNSGPKLDKAFHWIHIAVAISLTVAILIYVIVTIAVHTPRNLISLGGMVMFVLVFFVTSAHPSQVKVRPVFWGLAIQFIFALIILRWEFGFKAFLWLGARVSEFLSYSDEGAKFLFGRDTFEHHFFAFKVLPVVIYFSTAISILYYIGVMQFIIRNIARFMAKLLGTSAAESLNAAGNIFIGQSESPLMIRPFLEKMTKSELHAVLTGGFATIAGSVMAAYIQINVPANHLLSASVMSAPAALAMSKLFYPETEEIVATDEEVYNMEKGEERNIIEAAAKGASMSVKLVANIAANLIAFISLLGFVNATLKWFGERAGVMDPHLSFQLICSYVFWPLAFMLGVDYDDCGKVGELIGVKTFINEFVAYTDLSVYINNVKNITWYEGLGNGTNLTFWGADSNNLTGKWEIIDGDVYLRDLNVTLERGIMSDRSIVISTYALCGFSNIGSIGVMLGALGSMAPSRKSDLAKIVVRAMIAGNVACFMTACIAGVQPTMNANVHWCAKKWAYIFTQGHGVNTCIEDVCGHPWSQSDVQGESLNTKNDRLNNRANPC